MRGARILLSVARQYPRCLAACKSRTVSGIAAAELARAETASTPGLFPHTDYRGQEGALICLG
jgi:hypothetical protein